MTLEPDMPIWPGDPHLIFKYIYRIDEGDEVNLSELSLSSHTGTHVDAPFHFVKNGLTLDKIGLNGIVGEAVLLNIQDTDLVEAHHLEMKDIPKNSIVLLKTANSERYFNGQSFNTDYVSLSESGANFLADAGVCGVGIDALSIDPYKAKDAPAHNILLGVGVPIIEGLVFKGVEEGKYFLICLPLKVADAEGAPARAILLEQKEDFSRLIK